VIIQTANVQTVHVVQTAIAKMKRILAMLGIVVTLSACGNFENDMQAPYVVTGF